MYGFKRKTSHRVAAILPAQVSLFIYFKNMTFQTFAIYQLCILSLSGFFVSVSSVCLVSVHRKSVPLNKNIENVNLSGTVFK